VQAVELVRDALLEIAVIDPIDVTPVELQTLGMTRLNGILDEWNATRIATYEASFTEWTLTPALDPHTIGPTGTFVVTQRPVRILGANLTIGTGTSLVRYRIDVRDAKWWEDQPVPNIQSSVPTDLYYSADWPNGSLYFWPVPTAAYGVELVVAFVLAQLTVNSAFSMPPGYQRALMLTLAEDLLSPLSQPANPMLMEKARKARAAVFGNNNDPVRIRTRDAGMPGGITGGSGGFNWRTGQGGGR
jgi:hypothetical protein